MRGTCNYCGNAIGECPCLEHAKAIVAGIVHGDPKDKAMWFRRFLKLQGRFSGAQWGEMIQDEIARGPSTPRAPSRQPPRARMRYEDDRLPPRRGPRRR
jgi:hypothetical protein